MNQNWVTVYDTWRHSEWQQLVDMPAHTAANTHPFTAQQLAG